MSHLIYGYLSLVESDWTSGQEQALHGTMRDLADRARRENCHLAGVFSDLRGRTQCGFYMLLDMVRRANAVAVLVPDLGHLQHMEILKTADVRSASRYLRARVIPLA